MTTMNVVAVKLRVVSSLIAIFSLRNYTVYLGFVFKLILAGRIYWIICNCDSFLAYSQPSEGFCKNLG